MPISIFEEIRQKAKTSGFSFMGVSPAHLPELVGKRLKEFLALDYHGEMEWLGRDPDLRSRPQELMPQARSALVFAANYHQGLDHETRLNQKSSGVISSYALNRDYHEVMKGRLKQLAQWLATSQKVEVKVFVDTAPVMEKPLAQQAGLGWQGKHSNLVSRELGSWFFLGIILTSAEIAPHAPEQNHCGSCRACLDACPTEAFPAPYQLDAKRCLSYLTIEHKGTIAPEFRKPMGNRIYGCDDCLAACPWNKFAVLAQEMQFQARQELIAPALDELAALDDPAFRQLFSGSPVKRIGRNRFVRNVLIAIGNSGDERLIPAARARLDDTSELVRAMAVWALAQLLPRDDFAQLRQLYLPKEHEPAVRLEWEQT